MFDLWKPGSFDITDKETVQGWLHHAGLWGLDRYKDKYFLTLLHLPSTLSGFFSHEHANLFINTLIEYDQNMAYMNILPEHLKDESIPPEAILGVNQQIINQVYLLCLSLNG